MQLAKLMKAWREREKISVRELASQIGTNYMAVFHFEQGRSINHRALALIIAWALAKSEH